MQEADDNPPHTEGGVAVPDEHSGKRYPPGSGRVVGLPLLQMGMGDKDPRQDLQETPTGVGDRLAGKAWGW